MNAKCYKSFLSSFPLERATVQPGSPRQPQPCPQVPSLILHQGKTHSTFDFCSWSCENLLNRKPGGLWAHLRGMCYCHLHVPLPWLGGDMGLQSVALGKSVTPLAAAAGGKVMLYLGYCLSWGSFIFSAVHSYGHAHGLSLNHVPVLAIQLHSKEVTRLSLTSEFSFFPRYHISFII